MYKNTVSDALWEVLVALMNFEQLYNFRLVGGTSLSLLLGHRISVDIDLFTDSDYDSINFDEIDRLFEKSFRYVGMGYGGNNSFGKSYFIGEDKQNNVKVDIFYTDTFVYPMVLLDKIRLSRSEEIAAMKLEVIGNNGRKKDFWDVHELLQSFSLTEMISFYKKRYPYGYSNNEIIKKLTDFKTADYDFDPICLKNKYWELIKLDIEEAVQNEFKNS